jgi:hypothetical protein
LSDASKIHSLEEQLLQPKFRRNCAAVAELLAEDFKEFGCSGRVWSKQQIIRQLEAEPPFHAIMQDFHATKLATGAILVTYKLTTRRPETEATYSLRSSIWMRRDGCWQMLFHQGTIVPILSSPAS